MKSWASMLSALVILLPVGLRAVLPQIAPLHVLRIASGPTGSTTNDTFVLTEERSVFNREDDREIIVAFDWEGVPGPHRLVAEWRSQDGDVSSKSTIEYVAKGRRFGAFWRLPLSPTMPTGTWSIEATVDGQPGGRLTFEVTGRKVQPAVVKPTLAQNEVYRRLGGMFVGIERFSAAGRKLDSVSGFLGPGGRIYTTMAAVDDVDRIRGVLPDGSARDLGSLLAWNRRQDWAVIDAAPAAGIEFAVASAASVKVGDRCFSIEGSPSGGGVLTELSITGVRVFNQAEGGGWLATFIDGFGTPGAPVVNAHGELVGVVGTAMPGGTRLEMIMRHRADLKGVPIVPFGAFRLREEDGGTLISDLRTRGDLIPALAREQNVLSGGFAREIARTNTVAPFDQRDEFSPQEKTLVIFVTWSPIEQLKGLANIRLFDADNRPVMESKPKKMNLRKGQMSLSSWEVPIASLSGLYRSDVMLDGKPIWRGFVSIRP